MKPSIDPSSDPANPANQSSKSIHPASQPATRSEKKSCKNGCGARTVIPVWVWFNADIITNTYINFQSPTKMSQHNGTLANALLLHPNVYSHIFSIWSVHQLHDHAWYNHYSTFFLLAGCSRWVLKIGIQAGSRQAHTRCHNICSHSRQANYSFCLDFISVCTQIRSCSCSFLFLSRHVQTLCSMTKRRCGLWLFSTTVNIHLLLLH